MSYRPARTLFVALWAALPLALAGPSPSLASEAGDHERARQALAAGEILSLRTILERVEREYPGQVMEIELDRRHDGWRYEIKLLRSGGALEKLLIDARDGTVLGIKRKGDGPGHRGEHR